MRGFLAILLLSSLASSTVAQSLRPLSFQTQPALERGIFIGPYALFYEDPSGDTTKPLWEVAKQRFIPSKTIGDTRVINNRQMKRTSQVV